MSNVLGDNKQQQVLALGRLGWSLRRIQKLTGVRRETVAAYLREAGVAVRSPGLWGHGSATATGSNAGPPRAKPAIEVTTDLARSPPIRWRQARSRRPPEARRRGAYRKSPRGCHSSGA